MDTGTSARKRGSGRRFYLLVAAAITVLLLILSGCASAHNATSSSKPASGRTLSSGTPDTTPGMTPGTTAGGSTLMATLAPEAPNAAGSGTARLQMNPQQNTICFVVHVTGIALPATGANVHEGAAGATGPIAVDLTAPNAQGVSTGCSHVATALISGITEHPANYYISVHNAAYPNGAVRGQLAACGPTLKC